MNASGVPATAINPQRAPIAAAAGAVIARRRETMPISKYSNVTVMACSPTASSLLRLMIAVTRRPQVELVHLADQLGAKTLMTFFRGERESPCKIHLAGCGQRMIRPQRHSFVTSSAREGNAFVHQPAAQVVTPRGGIYQQDSQLRGGCIGRDAEYTADPAAIELRDPCGFASRVVLGCIVRHDPRDERLKTRIPSQLPCVYLSLRHDDPS